MFNGEKEEGRTWGGGGGGGRGRGLFIQRQCPKTNRFEERIRTAEADSILGLSASTRRAACYQSGFTPGSVYLLAEPPVTKEDSHLGLSTYSPTRVLAKRNHTWVCLLTRRAAACYQRGFTPGSVYLLAEPRDTKEGSHLGLSAYSPSGRVIPKKIHTWVCLLTRRAA